MKTLKQRQRRRIWLKLHFHLGLWLGMVFVVAGISGSLLVFYVDIDQWLNPHIAVQAQGKPQSLAAVLETLTAAHPQRQGPWRLELPLDRGKPLMARYYKPDETRQRGFAPLLVSVDPASLAITSKRFWGDTIMTWIYDLHYLLLIEAWGATIMGIVGLLLALSLSLGLYLWWPANANWHSALRWQPQAGRIRRTYDLHKFGGIYGIQVLLILALSGFALDLPAWANPIINWFSPLSQMPAVQSQAPRAQPRITIDSAVAVARTRFPQAEVRWVETPAGDAGTYLIRLYQRGEPGRRFPKTMVWVDQYSGKLLAQQDALQRSAGDGLLAWLHALHNGEAFGLAGRIIVLLSGLILPILFVTGLLRWQQKNRANRQVRLRHP